MLEHLPSSPTTAPEASSNSPKHLLDGTRWTDPVWQILRDLPLEDH